MLDALSGPGVPLHGEAFEQPFSTGVVAGEQLPCLSPAMQFIVHLAFTRVRGVDRHDLRLLASRSPRELAAVTEACEGLLVPSEFTESVP